MPKTDADLAMDAAACIGCGACVAACKNASAMLFVAAKVSHLNILPQGKPAKDRRVNAAFYGVPQLRERLILIGIDASLATQPAFPIPSHRIKLPSVYEGSRTVALKI